MNRVIREKYPEDCFCRELSYDICVPFRMWTEESLEMLNLLEPCGLGNPAPVFLLPDASVQSMRRAGRDGAHLQITVRDAGETVIRGIAFSMGDEADRPWKDVDLLYVPAVNRYNGRTSIEARVTALRESVC